MRTHLERSPADLDHVTMPCRTEPGLPAEWTPGYFSSLEKCPRYFYYEKLLGWRPKGDRIELDFGIAYHAGVEEYQILRAGGIDHEAAVHTTIKTLLTHNAGWISDDTSRTLATLTRAVLWYIDSERGSSLKPVIMASGEPALELNWKIALPWNSPDGEPYILRSHLDEVDVDKEDSEIFMIRERKTTAKSLGSSYYAQFKPNMQTRAFTLAGKVIFGYQTLWILMECCQTMVNGTRFGTHIVSYSDDEMEEFIKDLGVLIKQAESYAQANYWPMNTRSCTSYGQCSFLDVCSRSPSVRNVVLESDFSKAPSNWEINGMRNFLDLLPQLGF